MKSWIVPICHQTANQQPTRGKTRRIVVQQSNANPLASFSSSHGYSCREWSNCYPLESRTIACLHLAIHRRMWQEYHTSCFTNPVGRDDGAARTVTHRCGGSAPESRSYGKKVLLGLHRAQNKSERILCFRGSSSSSSAEEWQKRTKRTTFNVLFCKSCHYFPNFSTPCHFITGVTSEDCYCGRWRRTNGRITVRHSSLLASVVVVVKLLQEREHRNWGSTSSFLQELHRRRPERLEEVWWCEVCRCRLLPEVGECAQALKYTTLKL